MNRVFRALADNCCIILTMVATHRRSILRTPRAILALVTLALAPTSALAAPLPPEASSFRGFTVDRIQIEGVPGPIAKELRNGLALAGESSFLGRQKARLYPRVLERDLERARLYLSRHGYPGAKIEPVITPKRDARSVRILLRIDPGPEVRIGPTRVLGMPPGPLPEPPTPGSRFTDAAVDAYAAALEHAARSLGHAHSRVTSSVEPAGEATVALRFDVEPGPVFVFGDVRVQGVAPDLAALAGKSMGIPHGRRYDPGVLRRAEESLRLLDLFRQIRITTNPVDGDTLEVQADLVSRAPRLVEAGIGYWTDDLLRAHARWQHRNLFRAGRGFEIDGAWSVFTREAGTSLWWPAFFGPRTRLTLSADIRQDVEDSYDLLETKIGLGAAYRLSALSRLQAGIGVSDVNFTVKTTLPDAFAETGGLLATVTTLFTRDGSDDRFHPTRGTVSQLRGEWGLPGALSHSHFLLGEATLVGYRQVLGSAVAAMRVSGGIGTPLGDSKDLLPNRRFYSGGANSMRGFKRRGLGPLDAAGAPVGGEVKLEASTEIRFPIVWRFRGALFVDTGQVWSRRDQVALDQMQVAVGPGIMIQTPVGPLRADLGFLLTGDDASPVFHLLIGQPY